MTEYTVADQPKALNDLISSLNQALGAASQIIHMHQDPRWMMIRDALELTKEGVTSVASMAARLTVGKPA